MRAIVALLTDFGVRDHYAGTLKGSVLSVAPEATIVDISHEVPPHDVEAGAWDLAACYRYFPTGTVFLVVVDPGVGTSRRPLAAEASGYRFVAPDNGVLTVVFRRTPPDRIVLLADPRYARTMVSRTFEGRDRFAPAAGHLAAGVDLGLLGPAVFDPVMLPIPGPTVVAGETRGEVVRVDRFGNLITNIDREAVARIAATPDDLEVRTGPGGATRVVDTYAEIPVGEVRALFGSTDHLELAARCASAADALGLSRGAPVSVGRVDRAEGCESIDRIGRSGS